MRIPRRPVAVAFGHCLRKHRLRCGLSQKKLAGVSAFTRDYICVLERGMLLPNLSVLYRLAKALNTSAEALVSDTRSRLAGKECVRQQSRGETLNHA